MHRRSWILGLTFALLGLALSGTATAQTDATNGLWLAGEHGDDDQTHLIELVGTIGTFTRIGSTRDPMSVRLEPVESDTHHFELTVRRGSSPSRLYHFVLAGEGRALLWREGSRALLVAHRLDAIPETLQGLWLVTAAGDDGETSELTLTSDRATIVRSDGGVETPEAFAVHLGTPDQLGLVAFTPEEDLWVLNLQPFEGGFLVFPQGRKEFLFMYRPGSPPAVLED